MNVNSANRSEAWESLSRAARFLQPEELDPAHLPQVHGLLRHEARQQDMSIRINKAQHNAKSADRSVSNVAKSKYLEMAVGN
jgi:hypothetical protein